MKPKEKITKTLKDFGRLSTSRIAGIIGCAYTYTSRYLEEDVKTSLQNLKKEIKEYHYRRDKNLNVFVDDAFKKHIGENRTMEIKYKEIKNQNLEIGDWIKIDYKEFKNYVKNDEKGNKELEIKKVKEAKDVEVRLG